MTKWCAVALLMVPMFGCAAEKVDEAGKNPQTLSKVPDAAKQTITKVVGNNSMGDIETENSDGKTIYSAEYKVKGAEYEVGVSDAGEVMEQAVGVDSSAVPASVVDAVSKAHPDGKMGETDIVAAGGKLYYEIDVKAGDTPYEVKVNADGSVISDSVDKD
jgi:uncharacterized membrane protein YkoI